MNVLLLTLMLQIGNPSLFSDAGPNTFLFRDMKARAVGDLVTIQIVESSSASNSANTNTKKSGDVSVSAPSVLGLERGNSALNFSNILQGSAGINFAGQGTTNRAGQLQAALTARVMSVLPNGDLMIEGRKEVTINRERQILTITGIVRGRDITPSNMVLSNSIGNMEVKFDGKGIISDANKPGWLYKLFSLISPF